MKLKPLIAAIAALAASSAMAGPTVNWIDWNDTGAGTLAIGADTISVSLAGSPIGIDTSNGHYAGYPATYGGLAPHDMIQVANPGTFTLTFSKAVVDPYVAFVSVGQYGVPVTYTFNGPIIGDISHGTNDWGYGSYLISGNSITGREYNGVVRLSGTFKTLTVSVDNPEYWHGFNVGAVAAVPEPETYALMLAGLGLMGVVARRRKDSKA